MKNPTLKIAGLIFSLSITSLLAEEGYQELPLEGNEPQDIYEDEYTQPQDISSDPYQEPIQIQPQQDVDYNEPYREDEDQQYKETQVEIPERDESVDYPVDDSYREEEY